MKFEHIIEEWKVDSIIDPTEMVDELTKTARLHQKYLGYLMGVKAQKKVLQQSLDRLRREKNDYYRGRSEKPFPTRILAQEVETYIRADEDFQSAELSLEAVDFSVYYLEKVLKMIESRSWDVRSTADWLKYVGGR